MKTIDLTAQYYQQFDADFALDVPGEGYGGWKQAKVELAAEHTAVVVMHAWDTGTRQQYPGWHRAVEYIPRSVEISRTIFPGLLGAVRSSSLPLFHVVGGGDYYHRCPGYQRALALAGPSPGPLPQVDRDPVLDALQAFRSQQVFVGAHNRADVDRGFKALDFLPEARPLDSERWAGAVDSVGGTTLATVLTQMKYRGQVASCGLAGGPKLETTVIPFLLRGVNLLGIDSVMCPMPQRREAWGRLARDLPLDRLDAMTETVKLADLPRLAGAILKGQVRGRVVVETGA